MRQPVSLLTVRLIESWRLRPSYSDHTEIPFPERKCDDELAWSSIFKEALAKTKETAEVLKSGLDVNLIFVSS